jgi:hypothetical protein
MEAHRYFLHHLLSLFYDRSIKRAQAYKNNLIFRLQRRKAQAPWSAKYTRSLSDEKENTVILSNKLLSIF